MRAVARRLLLSTSADTIRTRFAVLTTFAVVNFMPERISIRQQKVWPRKAIRRPGPNLLLNQ